MLLAAILMGGAVSSCCACRQGSPRVGMLEDVTWRMIELNLDPIEDSPITLQFDGKDKMLYGQAPCNRFFGGYSLSDERDNIKIGNLGATRMMCPQLELENKLMTVLANVVRVKVDGDHLLMMDSEGNLLAVCVAVKGSDGSASQSVPDSAISPASSGVKSK